MQALRDFFTGAAALLASYFPAYQDRTLRLPSLCAAAEATAVGDAAAGGRVWEELLKTSAAK